MSSQGTNANKNGQIIENMLVPLFEGNGYELVVYGKSKFYPNALSYVKDKEYVDTLPRVVIYQYPYDSIYPNKTGKTEFLIRNKELGREIRVECKWQQGAGSVEEKIPYLYLNAVFAFPESEVIIVMDGGGLDKSAKPWLEKQCEERWLIDFDSDKQIRVMSIQEFVVWFNKELA